MKLSHFLIFLATAGGLLLFYSSYRQDILLISQKPIPVVAGINQDTTPLVINEADKTINLIATGDIMLGRSVNHKIKESKNYSLPFEKIKTFFKDQNIVLVNLESPFGVNCPITDTGMVFCADKDSVQGLKFLGVTHANLANNHINNQTKNGIELTNNILLQNQIQPVGLSTSSGIVLSQIKDTKIAFLGFNDIPPYPTEINKLSKELLLKQLSSATKSADFIIVSFHWGNEYQQRTKRQQEFAHLAIDHGANLVIGHHPHWVQEIETYKGVPIFYSLGNFVFDQMWSQKTREGIVAKVKIENNKVSTFSATPITINKAYQPIVDKNYFSD